MAAIYHEPVLCREALEYLQARPGAGLWADCTLGSASHSLALLEAIRGDGVLLGIERDPQMAAIARQRLEEAARAWPGFRFEIRIGSYCNLPRYIEELGCGAPCGILADVGANRLQLVGDRGFGFSNPGAPLDGRYNPEEGGPTIADLVNDLPEAELARILWEFGGERRSRAIARRICEARRRGRIERAGELLAIIHQAFPPRERHKTPNVATRSWQALRIAANNELTHLEAGLRAMIESLAPQGRLVVICFQGLESALCKKVFAEYAGRAFDPSNPYTLHPETPRSYRLVTRRPAHPSEEEVRRNPGAHSATLKCLERLPILN